MANHKLTQDEYVKKFDDLYEGRFSVVGEYISARKPINIRCNQCGNIFIRTRAANVTSGYNNLTCPFCDCKKVSNITIRGVDDLWTTDPDVASLLFNPEEGYKHGRGSGKIALFRCPHCENTLSKQINVVVKSGLSCNYCGDGFSYPNKFMMGLLDEVGIDFVPEFHFTDTLYRYDFQFDYNSIKYLVELDGAYGHGCRDTKSLTVEQQNYIDLEKNRLADINGYKIVRIDCKYHNSNPEYRFKYVLSSIRNSEISFLLDQISDDAIQKINNHANDYSKFLDFIEVWNNEERSYGYLMNKLHITKHTVLDYAKRAIRLGLI